MKMKQKQANAIDVAVGQRVRALRLEGRMSQTDLGNAVGLTFQQIQKYEKGMNRMGASRLQQFADIFKVGVPDLFGQAAEQTDKNSLFNLVDGGGAVRLLRAYNAMQENGMRIALVRLAESMAETPKAPSKRRGVTERAG
jgi:transcriptional regulator with XRE-family HTH domain